MKGLQLRSLTGELRKVAPEYSKEPVKAIRNIRNKLCEESKAYIRSHFGENFSFREDYYRLPLEVLSRFSFDELCKLYYSSVLAMNDSVDRLFEKNARYEVVRKIQSSMWRWGVGKGVWNEVVDAYECIRSFKFSDDPDFEIRLDYTTWFNNLGYSKFSLTFLDGVFAYLIYYKGRHVMTLGFSIMEKKRILIQQVQLASRTGNRFLFKLPKNRLEFVLGLFRRSFPGYRIYLVDGNSLIDGIIANYQRVLDRKIKSCADYERIIKKTDDPDFREANRRSLADTKKDCEDMRENISHLQEDKPRLTSFYSNIGRFEFGSEPLVVNELLHHRILRPSVMGKRTNRGTLAAIKSKVVNRLRKVFS